MSEEMKQRISERLSVVLKGKIPSRNTIEAARIANSKPKSEEHKRKISFSLTGKKQPPETIAKRVAKNKISLGGKRRTPEQRERMSNAQKGRVITEEHRQNLVLSHLGKNTGEKNRNWKGGISFEPYCPKFNDRFRERVRRFFGYKCCICGETQKDERLHVHHVNYNKQTCCDNTVPLFVSLCRSCHVRTTNDREYWEKVFTEFINTYYGGKSYV